MGASTSQANAEKMLRNALDKGDTYKALSVVRTGVIAQPAIMEIAYSSLVYISSSANPAVQKRVERVKEFITILMLKYGADRLINANAPLDDTTAKRHELDSQVMAGKQALCRLRRGMS